MPQLIIQCTRGGLVESIHRVDAVIADTSGKKRANWGNPNKQIYMRSAAKPLFAAFVARSGALDHFGITEKELAVIAASHGGQKKHQEAVRSILAKTGLGPEDLRCGAHLPAHKQTRKEWNKAQKKPTTLTNNCSGKHSGLLAVCRYMHLPLQNYLAPSHPLHEELTGFIAGICGVDPEEITLGIDGCGLPVPGLPLIAAARGYSALAAPEKKRDCDINTRQALERVRRAMLLHPDMIAGDGMFCTMLMQAAESKLVAKGGAEGVYGVGHFRSGRGLALKIEDGNSRAVPPAVLSLLEKMKWLGEKELGELHHFYRPQRKNARGEVVGSISMTETC